MSGWASLSGYLFIKPGGGGLNILKSKKRLWCVLEESQGKLLYFKSEEDARSKSPLGYIELCGAAITLDIDTPNQFVVIVDGREILLTAENHESMMIWLMALQARRDQFAKASNKNSNGGQGDDDPDSPHYDPEDNADWSSFDVTMGSRERSMSELSVFTQLQQQRQNRLQKHQHAAILHRPLEGARSFGLQGTGSTVSYLGHSPTWRRNQLRKMGATTDGNAPPLKNYPLSLLQPGSKQQSVSMEMTEVIHFLSPPSPLSNSYGQLSTTPTNTPHHNHQNYYNHPNPLHTTNNNNNHNNNNGGGGSAAAPFLNWSSSASSSADTTSDDVANSCLDQGSNAHRLLSRSASAREGSCLGRKKLSESVHNGSMSDSGDRVSTLEQELITTKCELARVLNRQTCFQEILKQKDEIIEDLDEKLGSKVVGGDGYDSKKRQTSNNSSKGNQERVRVLQNQNRFLNEEVRRLAKLRQHEHVHIQSQDSQVRSLEADIEVWKLEYISLIQSSIRFTGTDTMDDAELSLFGGDRHKHRILSLLEDARKINPSLPTYEYLSTGEVHVDTYGFKHQFIDDGLLLHYLCQELSQHFLSQASSFEKHQKQWTLYLKHNAKNLLIDRKQLKQLVRGGIPEPFRKLMWKSFVMAKVDAVITEKGIHYYRHLCNAVPDSPQAARYRKQISLDLMRTMPSNVKFSTPGSKGIMDLQDVLLAFCIHNPNVGYCQGMNFLVAMALLFMDAQDAFWTLVAVTECFHSPSYFDHNLLGAQADQSVLHDLMEEKMPALAKHLDAIEIEISTVTLNWFLALFFDAVPFQTLLRVWDCFLLEGPKVLFRFSLAILHSHSKEIMRKTDTISVMRHLKACARISYDIDGLVQAAFKTLKPFPRRQDIVSKQTFYLNGLKEKYRWREMQRVAYSERDGLLADGEAEREFQEGVFECCTITNPGQAWVAYGCTTGTKVCVVDMVDLTMTDTSIQIDSRVICMSSIEDVCVFMGTLSSVVYAWNMETRVMAWNQRVHDAVLSLQVYQDSEGDNQPRLFAALADGTVAVFDTVDLTCKVNDLLYLPIGQSPVSCLQLLGNQLWCASGNSVSVIQASTLDPMDQFSVSSNPYDTILSMVPGLPGVWISVRGSSVLELWDPASLSCKMLYDTCSGKAPTLKKDDDSNFNPARITSILALDHSVWVGTGEGTLYTFDVFTQNSLASEASSFFTDSLVGLDADCGQSLKSSSGRDTDAQKSDSYARIVEVEKRVKDLYLQRLVGQGFLGKRRKKKEEAGDGDEEEMDEEDNDTETEERRCLIFEKENSRETRRMKKKGGKGDEERRRVGGETSSRIKRKLREKLSSKDSNSSVKNDKNSDVNISKSASSKAVTNRGDPSSTTKIEKSLIHDSGIDSSVIRTSVDILSDEKENEEVDEGDAKNSLNNSWNSDNVGQHLIKSPNSRNSSTSSAHVLDKTIREEEDGEEELLNENLDVKNDPSVVVVECVDSNISSCSSSPKKSSPPAPDYPTVYYLFRPELDEEGRSSSTNTITNVSDETIQGSRENGQCESHSDSHFQSRAKRESRTRREVSSPSRSASSSSPRDLTKSEDSGISCSTEEKNTEASGGNLNNEDDTVQDYCQNTIAGNEINSRSDGALEMTMKQDEVRTGPVSLECCVNVSSQFYNKEEEDESNQTECVEKATNDDSVSSETRATTSFKSNGRSISEESAKTTGSDDVFCDEVNAVIRDKLSNKISGSGEESTDKEKASIPVNVEKKNVDILKQRVSCLSSQLEMDSNVTKDTTIQPNQFNSEEDVVEEEKQQEKSTNADIEVSKVGNEDDNINTKSGRSPSKSIAIAKSPVSNHSKNRKSFRSSSSSKSGRNSLDNNFSPDKINQIAEILSRGGSIDKFTAVNGINNHNKSSSSEEEESFGEYIGTPKGNHNGEIFNGNVYEVEAECSDHEIDDDILDYSPDCKPIPEAFPLTLEENELENETTITQNENLSDDQSESAYSTSSDSFHSDVESDMVESLSSSCKVKALAAKFEHNISLEEKAKNERHNSWKSGSPSKWRSSSVEDTFGVGKADDDTVMRPKNFLNRSFSKNFSTDSSQSWSSQRPHQKISRLSSSGQSEHLAHELESSASSSDKLPFSNRNSMTSNQSVSTHNHHHSKQILTTTSSGKMKLAKRASSKRLLLSSPLTNNDSEKKNSSSDKMPETIDTKYYGDSDEDKRVHEARVKSFKDSYRRLSVTNNPQKNQLKSADTAVVGKSIQNENLDSGDHFLQGNATSNSHNNNNTFPLQPSEPPKGSPFTTTTTTLYSNLNTKIGNISSNSNNTTPSTSTPSQPSTSGQNPPLPQPSSSPHNHRNKLSRMSSMDNSSIDGNNVPPRDASARWRLDYTNVHVDTDMESLAFSFDGGDSVCAETNTESDMLKRRLSNLSVTSDSREQRMNQFLRDTASTFEEHYKHVLEDEKVSFLHTPTLSRSNSVCWSSYDEISTPSQCDGELAGMPGSKQFHSKFPRSTTYSLASRSTSVASTVEVQFNVDMSLLSKNKISDKPVKWLLRTDMRGKPTVLSLAGAHSDDEAVLVWIREANETLWTNCPIFAYNPKTKTSTLPTYMRSQISSSSSSKSSPRQRLASLNSN